MSVAACVIVVMGVTGFGKSTIGSRLATRFACAFIEGDDHHTPDNVARMRSGVALTDDDRWPWLATIGRVAGEAARAGGHVVVACSALRRCYRDRLRDHAACRTLFVLLDADAVELGRRLAARQDHYMPASLLQSQLSLLEPPAGGETAKRFTARGDQAALIDEIAAWLRVAMAEY